MSRNQRTRIRPGLLARATSLHKTDPQPAQGYYRFCRVGRQMTRSDKKRRYQVQRKTIGRMDDE